MLNKTPILIPKGSSEPINTLPPKAIQVFDLLLQINRRVDLNLFNIDLVSKAHIILVQLKEQIEANPPQTEAALDREVDKCLTAIELNFADHPLYFDFVLDLVSHISSALTDILFPQYVEDYTYTPPQIDRVQEDTATNCSNCLALVEPDMYEFKKLLSKITENYCAVFTRSALKKLLRSFDQISVTEAESHSRTKGSHNSIRGEIDTSYANSTLGDDGLYVKNFLRQTFENNFNENTKAALGDEIYLKLYQEFIAALKKRYPKAFN